MTNPVMQNLCDCSGIDQNNFYKHCRPEVGSNCINSFKCPNDNNCTSFDDAAIQRRIQNQSRMPLSQYRDAFKSVTVSQDLFSFKGNRDDFQSMSSRVWGNPNYLRNQSDRTTPSRSGAWTSPGSIRVPFGKAYGMLGYVNAPTRGNSTKTTITANKPGAMTPGGQGVDVKHGSYHRYLAKKKGIILTKPSVTVTNTSPSPIAGSSGQFSYRNGFSDNNTYTRVFNSSGMNNMGYKFVPVSINKKCTDCKL